MIDLDAAYAAQLQMINKTHQTVNDWQSIGVPYHTELFSYLGLLARMQQSLDRLTAMAEQQAQPSTPQEDVYRTIEHLETGKITDRPTIDRLDRALGRVKQDQAIRNLSNKR